MNEYLMVMAEVEKARLSGEQLERARETESSRTKHPFFGRLHALIKRVSRHRPIEGGVGQTEDRKEL